MPKLIFKGEHEAEIRTATQQLSIPCKLTKLIIQKRKKRADKVVVDIAANDAIGLPLALNNAVPIGGWSAYSFSTGVEGSGANATNSGGSLPEVVTNE